MSAIEQKVDRKKRKELIFLAHYLKPVIQIGKKGLSGNCVEAIDRALADHELIKVRFHEFKDEKKFLTNEIEARTGSECIRIIGNTAILFRINPDKNEYDISAPGGTP